MVERIWIESRFKKWQWTWGGHAFSLTKPEVQMEIGRNMDGFFNLKA